MKAVSWLFEPDEKLPENPVIQYHLGMGALFKNGDRLKVKQSLNAAVHFSPNFPGTDEAMATIGMLEALPHRAFVQISS